MFARLISWTLLFAFLCFVGGCSGGNDPVNNPVNDKPRPMPKKDK